MPNVSRDMAIVVTVAAVKAYEAKEYAAKVCVAKADAVLVAMMTAAAVARGASVQSVASVPRLLLAKRAIRAATSVANAARHVTNGLPPAVVPGQLTTSWMTTYTPWILRMTR